jgi:lysophospholipid acyltransferase (LPLAT)-like uncharacterized protein
MTGTVRSLPLHPYPPRCCAATSLAERERCSSVSLGPGWTWIGACWYWPRMKRWTRHPLVQEALGCLVASYVTFALRTTRWTLEGVENVAPFASGRPVIVAFWHECLALMPMLWVLSQELPQARHSRAHVLVTRHRDGQLLRTALKRFGLNIVSGSSTRGGANSVRNLLALLGRGEHVAITPDGPQGPKRIAAPGVAHLAALSGAPVLPCAGQTSRRWVLRSWDRMVVPKPFARGVIVCGPAIAVTREGWQDALATIGPALSAASELADRLCQT